jgi:hypothetical protein
MRDVAFISAARAAFEPLGLPSAKPQIRGFGHGDAIGVRGMRAAFDFLFGSIEPVSCRLLLGELPFMALTVLVEVIGDPRAFFSPLRVVQVRFLIVPAMGSRSYAGDGQRRCRATTPGVVSLIGLFWPSNSSPSVSR